MYNCVCAFAFDILLLCLMYAEKETFLFLYPMYTYIHNSFCPYLSCEFSIYAKLYSFIYMFTQSLSNTIVDSDLGTFLGEKPFLILYHYIHAGAT